jgi:hypothetical protein
MARAFFYLHHPAFPGTKQDIHGYAVVGDNHAFLIRAGLAGIFFYRPLFFSSVNVQTLNLHPDIGICGPKKYFFFVVLSLIIYMDDLNRVSGHITLAVQQNQTLVPVNSDVFLFSLQNWNKGV